MEGVDPRFSLLKTQQKQYTQTIANKSVEDGVYIIVAVLFLGPSEDFHGIFVPAQAHRHQPIIELNR